MSATLSSANDVEEVGSWPARRKSGSALGCRGRNQIRARRSLDPPAPWERCRGALHPRCIPREGDKFVTSICVGSREANVEELTRMTARYGSFSMSRLATPPRLERGTCGLEVRRSIQLSYGHDVRLSPPSVSRTGWCRQLYAGYRYSRLGAGRGGAT